MLGILTTIAEANAGAKDFLQFYDRVGPLSGKTIIAGAVLFGSFGLLAAFWRKTNPPVKAIVVVTTVLVAIGFVMTFPIFFQAFASEWDPALSWRARHGKRPPVVVEEVLGVRHEPARIAEPERVATREQPPERRRETLVVGGKPLRELPQDEPSFLASSSGAILSRKRATPGPRSRAQCRGEARAVAGRAPRDDP